MRKRFFMIARCDGKPIVWPEPTHAPADSDEVKAGLLKPYVGAYTQLDFSLPCPSIFDTSEEIKEKYGIRAVRPLAPKTMERIARGLKKFVLDNPEPFIVPIGRGKDRRLEFTTSKSHCRLLWGAESIICVSRLLHLIWGQIQQIIRVETAKIRYIRSPQVINIVLSALRLSNTILKRRREKFGDRRLKTL